MRYALFLCPPVMTSGATRARELDVGGSNGDKQARLRVPERYALADVDRCRVIVAKQFAGLGSVE